MLMQLPPCMTDDRSTTATFLPARPSTPGEGLASLAPPEHDYVDVDVTHAPVLLPFLPDRNPNQLFDPPSLRGVDAGARDFMGSSEFEGVGFPPTSVEQHVDAPPGTLRVMDRFGLPDGIVACLFDLDGVLTHTAAVHMAAWRAVFDPLLDAEGQSSFTDEDYLRFVDGKPRRDGVRDFLASRGIELAEGSLDDPPEAGTVAGVGNRKNVLLLEKLAEDGVEVFPGSVDYLRVVHDGGLRTAVVTASANGEQVIRAAGLEPLIEQRIDGLVAHREGLPGKPQPHTFLAAARLLGVEPAAAAIFEDAIAGVAAGRAGDFGFVVGVNRHEQADALHGAGADVVVDDLSDLLDSR
jgi:beta-phosphoglucomutase-like phosphatase (HAD superfamily)